MADDSKRLTPAQIEALVDDIARPDVAAVLGLTLPQMRTYIRSALRLGDDARADVRHRALPAAPGIH